MAEAHGEARRLYGTTSSDYTKFWSAPPLFLEDENIFQKSGSMVPYSYEFRVVI
jgi:hypothetical protein